jgi:NAD-dependent DNA ligase
MSSDKSKSKYDGLVIALCPVCGQNIRYPESIYRGPNQHRCQERRLQAIDKPRRRSGRNPARSEGERIEEGFKMMEMDD